MVVNVIPSPCSFFHCGMMISYRLFSIRNLFTIMCKDFKVHIGYVNESEMVEQPVECKLEELLHPPAYRESVEKLRSMQKLSHHTKRQLFDKTKAEWRKLPKSYPIMNMLR